ncbi:hypothetical protein [Sphingomonas abietis]|uniref:Uncharacterized protein n=1 Tax=Sphingomonas abietis TaxID=3012344 RepID=A0ABY7NVN3_9SPHN|nr:hypothetical protein [Sphingomonas abietis]WBO23969.1 hypothetical protein PBT88_07620 [Sphingomonas abietis]
MKNAIAAGDIYAASLCPEDEPGKSDGLSEAPTRLASAKRLGWRQDGMRPLVFQLDTVEGVSERPAATALVPPRLSMMALAVCICANYDNRNSSARGKLRCP